MAITVKQSIKTTEDVKNLSSLKESILAAARVAKENGIKTQIKKLVAGGNDAKHIHPTGVGVRVLALSAPTRYLHSPACVADIRDYEAMKAHIAAIVTHWTL